MDAEDRTTESGSPGRPPARRWRGYQLGILLFALGLMVLLLSPLLSGSLRHLAVVTALLAALVGGAMIVHHLIDVLNKR